MFCEASSSSADSTRAAVPPTADGKRRSPSPPLWRAKPPRRLGCRRRSVLNCLRMRRSAAIKKHWCERLIISSMRPSSPSPGCTVTAAPHLRIGKGRDLLWLATRMAVTRTVRQGFRAHSIPSEARGGLHFPVLDLNSVTRFRVKPAIART